jgi:hypothetical protein
MRFVILLVLIAVAVLGASSSPIEGDAKIELADGNIIFCTSITSTKKKPTG